VIVTAGGIDELNKLGRLAPGVPMAKPGVGVAVRVRAPRPDISSGEALKRALLASKSIALSPGPSGVYLSSLFAKWGVADELKPKIKQATGLIGDVVARLPAGERVAADQGITYLGPLSDDIQLIMVFSGAVDNLAKNPTGASSLLKFLTSPDAAQAIGKSGMEPGGD
jgi:molybdate transport system substrate-binding protein